MSETRLHMSEKNEGQILLLPDGPVFCARMLALDSNLTS